MKDFFKSSHWNTFYLLLIGILAVFTQEIVTFVMLGLIMIMLSNIYDVLQVISRKMDRSQ
ncbi:MAG: hypothetical protein ACOX0F_10210 [Syntrophomonadaceae bacterium]|jgi:hypothetical protein